MRRSPFAQFVLLSSCCLIIIAPMLVASTMAQEVNPSAVRTTDLKKIDSKASKVEDEFVRNAYELANEYEKAGDLERSIEYLEAMLKIKPDLPGAKDKIAELKDDILTSNDFDFRLDVVTDWGKPVAFVRAGKPFRIQAAGSYKLTLSEVVGPNGFPAGDIQKEMLEDISPGKLVGMIINPNARPGNQNNDEKKMSPFEVGAEKEVTPKQTGYLFLKLNAPPQARLSGTLQIRLSGYVLAPDGKNIGK